MKGKKTVLISHPKYIKYLYSYYYENEKLSIKEFGDKYIILNEDYVYDNINRYLTIESMDIQHRKIV